MALSFLKRAHGSKGVSLWERKQQKKSALLFVWYRKSVCNPVTIWCFQFLGENRDSQKEREGEWVRTKLAAHMGRVVWDKEATLTDKISQTKPEQE